MAVWQFYCNIISQAKTNNTLDYDEMKSWKDVPQPKYNIHFLQLEKSWSQDIVQYGNIDETCIEFIYDEDKLEEIRCRLDLRSLTKYTLSQLVGYVQKIEACFLVENNIYPPQIEIVINVMMQSNANRYCKSPIDYIKSLK